MAKPNGPDPTAIDLTRPPGLVGLLVDHGERCTPFATRWPALAGALVGFAAATRNRFAVRVGPDNLMPINLYLAVIGNTGVGKETALRLATSIAEAGGVKPAAFASAEGLHTALAAEPKDGSNPKCRLLTQDEWGRALQQIKADKAGHQRGVMTKCMECYGLAIGGTLKERSYANPRNNVPAVRNPFLCALFASTPSTMLDALTSAEVVDGSLNRTPMIFLDPDPPLRDLDAIHIGPIPERLATRIARASNIEFEETGEPRAPDGFMKPVRTKTFRDSSAAELAGQHFAVVKVEPPALAALKAFRANAIQRARADAELGPLWSRAFEHAVRLAGVVAVGEACVAYGPLVVRKPTALWAIALVRHCIETATSLLRDNLADTPAELTRLRIMHHAWTLAEAALHDLNPPVENSAPPSAQAEIRNLKTTGWFPKSALINRAHHKGCSSRDLATELQGLVEAEQMAAHAVEWQTSTGRREKRVFFRPLDGGT